jgi:hypothetical protein
MDIDLPRVSLPYKGKCIVDILAAWRINVKGVSFNYLSLVIWESFDRGGNNLPKILLAVICICHHEHSLFGVLARLAEELYYRPSWHSSLSLGGLNDGVDSCAKVSNRGCHRKGGPPSIIWNKAEERVAVATDAIADLGGQFESS